MKQSEIKTFCRDCKHYTGTDSSQDVYGARQNSFAAMQAQGLVGTQMSSPLYQFGPELCMATPLDPEVSPVTGKALSPLFAECKSVNTGNCSKFVEKEGLLK